MNKRIGGWIIPHRLYLTAAVATELWYFGRRENEDTERQVHLFFIGWYDHKTPVKLFSITILWLSIKFAYVPRSIE